MNEPPPGKSNLDPTEGINGSMFVGMGRVSTFVKCVLSVSSDQALDRVENGDFDNGGVSLDKGGARWGLCGLVTGTDAKLWGFSKTISLTE